MDENTTVPWPNNEPVVDGIVPVEEVPQDADLLDIDDVSDSDPDLEMED
jgi:hypothetical protein